MAYRGRGLKNPVVVAALLVAAMALAAAGAFAVVLL